MKGVVYNSLHIYRDGAHIMSNTAAAPTRDSGVDIYLTVCCQETINNGRYGKRRRGVCGLCCVSQYSFAQDFY